MEDFVTWVLTTPVQFYSGRRFYRDAYYGVRGGKLGMSFFIAVGTSAAYFYSVFVVIYNANLGNINDHAGEDDGDGSDDDGSHVECVNRLMNTFETSALLITFVILGKYLECRANSATSKALSKLSHL